MTENNVDVKVVGVANELPQNPKYFTEISIPETLKIPDVKPDIEQLVEVIVQAEIKSMRLIDTPCLKSYEGQLLSGKKLILELKLIEKIVYVADEETQSVHAAHFGNILKSVFVIVPKSIGCKSIDLLLKAGKVRVTPYIEDIYAVQKDKRTVFKNITILINVDIICK